VKIIRKKEKEIYSKPLKVGRTFKQLHQRRKLPVTVHERKKEKEVYK
jgi:hypothetical protein